MMNKSIDRELREKFNPLGFRVAGRSMVFNDKADMYVYIMTFLYRCFPAGYIEFIYCVKRLYPSLTLREIEENLFKNYAKPLGIEPVTQLGVWTSKRTATFLNVFIKCLYKYFEVDGFDEYAYTKAFERFTYRIQVEQESKKQAKQE